MPKIITTNDVRSALKKERYTLLDEYQSSQIPFRFRCPKGHEGTTTWKAWRIGGRCQECKSIRNQVVSKFIELGYILEDTYKNNFTPMKFICDQGHENVITWSSLSRGGRCSLCMKGNKSRQLQELEDSGIPKFTKDKLNPDWVSLQFEKEGYSVLSEYINSKTKIKVKCPKGHENSMTWAMWSQGRRCTDCTFLSDPEQIKKRKYNKRSIKFENVI